jgi:uncharacterized membrane protein
MKPLFILIIVFILGVAISRIAMGQWNLIFSGNLAMLVMLCLTAMGHFMFTKGMTMMMPGFIPFKTELVYFTGIAEVLLGLGLLFPRYRYMAGIILVVLFVLMLPANINAAIKHVNFEKATYDGSGPAYLWFRIPLQLFFIGWLLFFSIKPSV